MKNVVEVKNVVKSFKDKIVLNHVSFSMKPGEIVGFVGQNEYSTHSEPHRPALRATYSII